MPWLDRVDAGLIEPGLGALDRLRAGLLKSAAPASRWFVRYRDRRVVALAAFACAAALVLSVRWTGYLLLAGPLLFGVPHLVVEARYLYFQRHRGNAALLIILLLQSALAFAGVGIYGLGPCSVLALIAVRLQAGQRILPSLTDARDWALLGLFALVQGAVLIGPTWSRFGLLHIHNALSIFVWLVWRERPRAVSLLVTALLGAGAFAIGVGLFDRLPIHTPLRDSVFSLTRLTDAVAGGFGGAYRRRFLMLFCFLQSLHYAVWLRLLPEEARGRETPRSWTASWRAFQADCGPNIARLCLLAALLVPLLALPLGAVRVRSLYVTASEFHATVELILIFLLLRRAPSHSPAAT